MKFCPECDYKLPQPNPKFCSECGTALSSSKDAPAPETKKTSEKKAQDRDLSEIIESKREEKKAQKNGFLNAMRKQLFAFVLAASFFILLLAIVIYPVLQWERAKTSGTNYYQYSTIFNNDLNNLASLTKQYDSIPLSNETFSKKAKMASNYALKASQAVTTWDYLKSFILRNEGPLQRWNVDTASALSKIEDGKSTVQRTAKSMSSELERFSREEKSDNSPIADTLRDLNELVQ